MKNTVLAYMFTFFATIDENRCNWNSQPDIDESLVAVTRTLSTINNFYMDNNSGLVLVCLREGKILQLLCKQC